MSAGLRDGAASRTRSKTRPELRGRLGARGIATGSTRYFTSVAELSGRRPVRGVVEEAPAPRSRESRPRTS